MKTIISLLLFALISTTGCTQEKKQSMKIPQIKYKTLTPQEERVIVYKGTEAPYTGEYNEFFEEGTYVCKRCGAPLYNSTDKFKSECGWPSFDDEIKGAVKRVRDADGMRTEIVCANCGAHLGHVFTGEHLTDKNTRHCVNSISMEFVPAEMPKKQDTAYFAGGCFWGVEYYMEQIPGVKSTDVGYINGRGDNPSYEEVCSHTTGYAEAVRVIFNPQKVSYNAIAKMFFEIHDPTQLNRQGPDVGDQYRSAVFYRSPNQKLIAMELIMQLKKNGYDVVTQVVPATKFWKAEEYHQDYYARNGHQPYCHRRVKRF